jgi:hypothetical protein
LIKALLIAALSSLVASAVIGILVFLFGDFNDNQQHLLLTTLAVGGFSLIGLANTARRSSWWLWPLRPVGLATAVVALGLAVPLIWELIDDTQVVWKPFATLSVLAITSAHILLLGSFDPRNSIVGAWRIVAMMVAAGMAGLIFYGVWGQIDDSAREFYFRGIGVAVILDVLGTVGLYPVSRLVGKSRRSALKNPRSSAPRRRPAKRRLSPSR